ncbi:MAG TPA: cytochrome D1 domain-containing protein [Gaiellaceae bacterium]|nr:cytochrome D1 domain-containing protein [Gaiellaceae bacterium]
MRRLLVLAIALVLLPAASARASANRPVAIVAAETSNQVIAVSLGPRGGRVLKRVSVVDPLMVAAPLHGPAVVLSPSTGTVTLLAWHTLRPVKVFHGFRDPEVARIAPDNRYAYVADGGTGDLTVIDLWSKRVVGRLRVGAGAHHMSFSPDGKQLWIALSEVATTVVRLDISDLAHPRLVGRLRPRRPAHSVGFAPDGRTVWLSSARAPYVTVYSAATGRVVKVIRAGRAPQEIAFSGARALLTSGYGSSIEAVLWRTYRRLGTVPTPYGSFNLATFGGQVVTSSLLTGQVTQLEAGTLRRFWTVKVAPETRYVAISLWPR